MTTLRDHSRMLAPLIAAGMFCLSCTPGLSAADDPDPAAPKGAAVTVLKAAKACFANIVEVTGTESEIDAFVALVRTYGIKELVRTGAVVMARGSGSIEEAIKR